MAKKGKDNAQGAAAEQPETLDAAVSPAAVAPEAETPLALGGGDAAEATGQEHAGAADNAAGDGSDGHSGELSDGEGAQGGVAPGQEPGAGAEGQDAGAGDTGPAPEIGEGTPAEDGISSGTLEGALSSGGSARPMAGDGGSDADQGKADGGTGDNPGDDHRAGNDGGGDDGNDQTSGGDAGAEPGSDRGDGSAISGADGSAGSGDAAGTGGPGSNLRDGGDGGRTDNSAIGGGDPAAGDGSGDRGVQGEAGREDRQDQRRDDAGGDGLETHVEDPTLAPADGIVAAAEAACFAVGDYLVEFWEFDQAQLKRLSLLAGQEHSRATNAIAALVRNIGKDRATPAVCGQQLKILGLIDDPELSDVETLIVQTFVNVLAGIDAYEAREAARLEAARAEPEERKPIPIEDTTMELVDDTLDTFGGQG